MNMQEWLKTMDAEDTEHGWTIRYDESPFYVDIDPRGTDRKWEVTLYRESDSRELDDIEIDSTIGYLPVVAFFVQYTAKELMQGFQFADEKANEITGEAIKKVNSLLSIEYPWVRAPDVPILEEEELANAMQKYAAAWIRNNVKNEG